MSGAIAGGVHRLELRVYYEDTDAGGVVYHANYLKLAERARTEMLRLAGLDHPALLAGHGVSLVVRRASVEFLRPARLDDLVRVETTALAMSGAQLRLRQTLWRRSECLALLEIAVVTIGPRGRPRRLPQPLRDALRAIIEEA